MGQVVPAVTPAVVAEHTNKIADSETSTNNACGEDSDCINRATKMECVSDCTCGDECQNRRFQERAYADVSVIKTDKKGYGLRTNKDLKPHQLIYEYIGEVIGESKFRSRMSQYDEEGIKHFYFMSLSKGEFVDATRRGNLGRFCNHSCNPNCYVDKWVVGDRLRMGIFAERHIVRGEELVFNYNVDRYGANPQPCYCGEPNCTGFIGGKTQTERATKLSTDTIEALGIEDADDWDLAVAKKGNKKKKTGEVDEEYVDRVQPKSLEEGAVTKVMATLMQCKEKWIAVKLLNRIQECEDERVRTRVVKMHGYRILKSVLTTFAEDVNVVLQVFDILDKLPRITRNKIQDSKIEETVEKLKTAEDERVREKAVELMKVWAALEVGYRIPRAKRDPKTAAASRSEYDDRRRMARERSRSKSRERSLSPSVPRGPAGAGTAGAPSGPRNSNGIPGRPGFGPGRGPPAFRRPLPPPLPTGWFQTNNNGRVYYYTKSGQTSWVRPTTPATAPPPTSKAKTHEQKLQDIIESITSSTNTPKTKPSGTSTPQSKSVQSPSVASEPKWKSWPEEKQMKLYENTLFPYIKHVVNKYKNKLPNEDLKRFAKEISKKLVASDYKNKRVTDPGSIDEKQARKVKTYCKDFFDKAVKKQQDRQKGIAEKAKSTAKQATASGAPSTTPPGSPLRLDGSAENGNEITADDSMPTPHDLDDEDESPGDAKRKREEAVLGGSPYPKKARTDDGIGDDMDEEEPPPPPPPPPNESPDMMDDEAGMNGNGVSMEALNADAVGHNGEYAAAHGGSEEYEVPQSVNGHGDGSQTLDESRDIEVS